MTLGNIRDRILRTTKTNSSGWGTTYADMAIAINNAKDRVDSIIRTFISNYVSTDFSGSDVNTGTTVPKFNSKFHELLALWPEYDYAMQNALKSTNAIYTKIQLIEREVKMFYGLRNYKITTVTIASPGLFTLDCHGFKTNDRVILETTGALPTGLSAETWYYVIYTDAYTFKLAATRDGAAINTSGTQSGTHYIGQERQGRVRRSYENNK